MKIEKNFWKETSDKLNANLNHFKNWDVVRQIPIYNHGVLPNYTNKIYEPFVEEVEQMIQPKLQTWIELLKEPMRGHTPESYALATADFPKIQATAWTIKSAHHILTLEEAAKRSILDYEQIVEIGPGIGETARMILDLGFKNPYRAIDLPAVYQISSYYLSDYPNVSFHNDCRSIPSQPKTLVIGTWSFSELSFELRDRIVDYFRGSDFHFLWQRRFYDLDNKPYFETHLPSRLPGYRCMARSIPKLPKDMYFTALI